MPRKFATRRWKLPALVSRQASSLGRPYLSKFIALARLVVSQRSEMNLVEVLSCASEASALRSLILKVTPFFTTGCFGSAKRMAAGVQPWQMPNQVGMQRPLVLPVRLAQISPSLRLHCDVAVQAFEDVIESMPWYFETMSSTFVPPNAFWYFIAGESLLEPSQR